MRAGVQQIFALDINFRAAELFGQALGVIERRGTAGEVFQQIGQLGLKRRIVARFEISLLQLFERSHQHFGYETSAVGSEVSGCIWLRSDHFASCAALMKARIFS